MSKVVLATCVPCATIMNELVSSIDTYSCIGRLVLSGAVDYSSQQNEHYIENISVRICRYHHPLCQKIRPASAREIEIISVQVPVKKQMRKESVDVHRCHICVAELRLHHRRSIEKLGGLVAATIRKNEKIDTDSIAII